MIFQREIGIIRKQIRNQGDGGTFAPACAELHSATVHLVSAMRRHASPVRRSVVIFTALRLHRGVPNVWLACCADRGLRGGMLRMHRVCFQVSHM